MFFKNGVRLFYILLISLLIGGISFTIGCNESDDNDSDSVTSVSIWYKDADGDGYGDPDAFLKQQSQPTDYVTIAGDCNDYDPDTNPGAVEICDGLDNNCNGHTDENVCGSQGIQINGKITNFTEANDYITKDSYLQLIYLDGTDINFTTDGQGRLMYSADQTMPVTELPDDGIFSFNTWDLIPGKYIIIAQLLQSYSTENAVSPILAISKTLPAVIEIPETYTLPFIIELGDILIPLPDQEIVVTPSASQSKLSPPTGVSSSDGLFTDSIRVTWDSTANAISYDVYRADSFGGTKTKIDTTTNTSYDDTSVSCNKTYYYWITANNEYGASEMFYSDLGYARCPAPPAPTGVSVSDGFFEDKIQITWNNSNGATSYKIFRASSFDSARIEIASVNNNYYSDTSAFCSTTYYYWIQAFNSSSASDYSNYDSGHLNCETTSTPPGTATTTLIPTGVKASDGVYTDKIRITWNLIPEATAYGIYRSISLTGKKNQIAVTSDNYYNDTNAHMFETYYYWVRVVAPSVACEYSSYVSGHRLCPSPPTRVLASRDKLVNKVRITWNAAKGATSYDIYRSQSPLMKKTRIGSTTQTWYDDKTVDCNDTLLPYYYWVKAICRFCTSDLSNISSPGTPHCLPSPPINLRASDGQMPIYSIKIKWDVCGGCSNTLPSSYEVYRATSLNGTKTKIAATADTFYVDTSVCCPDIYYYWIKAKDAKGFTSEFSDYDTGYCPGY